MKKTACDIDFSNSVKRTKIGNTISKIGYSAPIVQDRTQNWVHRNGFFLPFGYQNFYVNYDYFKSGIYLYGGAYQPFSLWGY